MDCVNAKRTIEEYDRVIRQKRGNGLGLDAPVGRGGLPPASLVEGDGPFYAIEVQPSYVSSRCLVFMQTDMTYRITFTYGGINIDKQGHALAADKTIIQGLLVAGVDAGGFSNLGYAGGLALAFVTGIWAAREVARDLRLPLPRLPVPDARDAETKPIKGRL